MKEPEQKKDSKFTQAALLGAVVLIVGLLGLIGWLRGRAESMKARLAESKEQYEEMKKLKTKFLDLKARGASDKGPQNMTDGSIRTILEKKANDVGLPIQDMRSATPQKSGGWTEIAISIQFGAQAQQGTSVPRDKLIDFLATVEQECPYLKSKNLQMNFVGADTRDPQRATVVISYFKRE